MNNSETGELNKPRDWIVKICDYGLARSLAGITSAKVISDVMLGHTPRKRKETDPETTSSS
jgi:hypothetical protein